MTTIDSFASEIEQHDHIIINSETWTVLDVGRTQPGLVHVYTDHDVLTLPANALVELAVLDEDT